MHRGRLLGAGRAFALVVVIAALAGLPQHASAAGGADAPSHFEQRIRPLLLDRCVRCHSGAEPKGGLRLDSAEGLARGGDSGPVLDAKDAEESLLLRAIAYDGDLQMPPDNKLADDEVAALVDWVKSGAPWPAPPDSAPTEQQPHWAFQPVQTHEPPTGEPEWSTHPIDRFLAEKWREHSLHSVAAADRRTLLRRVYFDLIGLPPQPEEMQVFLADDAPDAFARVVDRLLASPRYGERWGRHWLDVARYADTAGDNADYPVPEARLYRDYVIDAFNADMPYDQFIHEQLAGDILANASPSERYSQQVTATTFLALSRRFATAPYEFWHLTLEDTVDTVGQAFMGLTLRCARCHDHKYDPITSRDYYGLYGIFQSTQYPWAGGEEFASKNTDRQHFVPLMPASEAEPRLAAHSARLQEMKQRIAQEEKEGELARKVAALNARIAACDKAKEQTADGQPGDSPSDERTTLTAERDTAAKELEEHLGKMLSELRSLERSGMPPDLPGAYAVREGQPASAAIQLRGDPATPGEVVPRGVIASLIPKADCPIPENQSGRLQLAQWLTRPDQPLTARVMVNRIWQHHFGQGIVATPSNFGLRGARPTHPELLDWLAAEFMRGGWSIKHMHRLILSSQTWQLASIADPENSERDPANQYLWRHERRRLDAEAIRDALLATSGLLDLSRPGEHPFPPLPEWRYTQHSPYKAVYESNHRSVYLMTQRLQRHPYLALFDGPDTNATTDKRTNATVPLQALYLMNSDDVCKEAEAFAQRLVQATNDDAERVRLAHEWAYAREATLAEVEFALNYLERYRQALAASGRDAPDNAAWISYARVLLIANEFCYVD